MIKRFNASDINIVPFGVSKTIILSSKRNSDLLLLQDNVVFDDYFSIETTGPYIGFSMLSEDGDSYFIPEYGMSTPVSFDNPPAAVEFEDFGDEQHIIYP